MRFTRSPHLEKPTSDLFKEVLAKVMFCLDDIATECEIDPIVYARLRADLKLHVIKPAHPYRSMASRESIQISSDYFFQNEFSTVGEESMHYLDINLNIKHKIIGMDTHQGLEFLAKLYSNIVCVENGSPFMEFSSDIESLDREIKRQETAESFSLKSYCDALKRKEEEQKHLSYLDADRIFKENGVATRAMLKRFFWTQVEKRYQTYEAIGEKIDVWA